MLVFVALVGLGDGLSQGTVLGDARSTAGQVHPGERYLPARWCSVLMTPWTSEPDTNIPQLVFGSASA